ncbi:MAG TPA: hypothetical protein EYP60_04975 [bacterium (Candidatus Stahlbacteria)]|nr:hypothetical protein [Candidatus Stahlbacteria bacterium]
MYILLFLITYFTSLSLSARSAKVDTCPFDWEVTVSLGGSLGSISWMNWSMWEREIGRRYWGWKADIKYERENFFSSLNYFVKTAYNINEGAFGIGYSSPFHFRMTNKEKECILKYRLGLELTLRELDKFIYSPMLSIEYPDVFMLTLSLAHQTFDAVKRFNIYSSEKGNLYFSLLLRFYHGPIWIRTDNNLFWQIKPSVEWKK